MTIRITFPADRTLPGVLRLLEAEVVLMECPALGKADNEAARRASNPTRDPVRKMGDTPLGSYRARVGYPLSRDEKSTRTYGPHPVIELDPLTGDALTAEQNGRTGLLIHGGVMALGRLRPTFGCVRVSDEAQAQIVAIMRERGECECLVEEQRKEAEI